MISDVETILSAFTGNWKPGIEEQSIRMAHAVALQGDTATASNILKFIAIPEPMKLQILGASLSAIPVEVPKLVANDTLVTSAPKMMPEPLIADSDSPPDMSISTVSEASLVVEPTPVEPAFAAELTQTVPAEQPTDTIIESPLPAPSNPQEALPFQRDELFSKAFASVQADSASETSRPMVRDADNIPVIHTYETPLPSEASQHQAESVQAQKGLKLFQSLDIVLRRALASTDSDVRNAALAQWERLNTEFPDYKTFHRLEWSAMEGSVNQIKKESTSQIIATPIVAEPIVPNAPVTEESLPQAFTPTPVITSPVPVPASGGYFARSANASMNTETPAEAPVVTSPVVPAKPEGPGGYFAQRISSEQKPSDTIDSPAIEAVAESTEVEEYTLVSGLKVTKNMTITGASVYRIQTIRVVDNVVTIVFTDEIHNYVVPSSALSAALDNPDTEPDTFFAQYKI